ncbi:MAG: Uma2 family endonuclease [Desertifilum sp. SIO1I2]|nr:Uma2 family endonuclease [Desertifilum sp. SIO1I2]
MFSYDPKLHWPGAEDLPDSDDTPVDNELQDLIPGLLKSILALIWPNRWDWFFGVDMGIYYHPDEPPIIPDGFLSLGVERVFDPDLRLSYVLWEERVIPQLVVEVVSETYRGEYSRKKESYGELGVLYYAVYNPRRRRKPRLEVYQLVDGVYELLSGEPVWLAQIGLGIGRAEGTYLGIKREWLYWFDERGERFLTPEERLQDAELRAQRLAEQLRSLGVDPQEY